MSLRDIHGALSAAEREAMNAQQWLACTDLLTLLRFLEPTFHGRKARLFAVACCRRLMDVIAADRAGSLVVELAEQHADLAAPIEELARARHSFLYFTSTVRLDVRHALAHAAQVEHLQCFDVNTIATLLAHSRNPTTVHLSLAPSVAETRIQCALLRDIAGNPFQPATLDADWLAWGTGKLVTLAHAAYQERALPSGELDGRHLAVLADALEEAGCTNHDIVAHLRSPGPHVRGCWVVDLLLGKA